METEAPSGRGVQEAARGAMWGAALVAALSVIGFLNLAIGDSTRRAVLAGMLGLVLAAPLLAAAPREKGLRGAACAGALAGSAAYVAALVTAVDAVVRPRGDFTAFGVAWAASAALGVAVARVVAGLAVRRRTRERSP